MYIYTTTKTTTFYVYLYHPKTLAACSLFCIRIPVHKTIIFLYTFTARKNRFYCLRFSAYYSRELLRDQPYPGGFHILLWAGALTFRLGLWGRSLFCVCFSCTSSRVKRKDAAVSLFPSLISAAAIPYSIQTPRSPFSSLFPCILLEQMAAERPPVIICPRVPFLSLFLCINTIKQQQTARACIPARSPALCAVAPYCYGKNGAFFAFCEEVYHHTAKRGCLGRIRDLMDIQEAAGNKGSAASRLSPGRFFERLSTTL